jgi:hypothetical protein
VGQDDILRRIDNPPFVAEYIDYIPVNTAHQFAGARKYSGIRNTISRYNSSYVPSLPIADVCPKHD